MKNPCEFVFESALERLAIQTLSSLKSKNLSLARNIFDELSRKNDVLEEGENLHLPRKRNIFDEL